MEIKDVKRIDKDMTHYNPMLEKLQRQIQEYNKDTENRIEEVANRQNLITLAFVVFNIVVFIVLESVLGKREPILLDIPNTVINFVATLILGMYLKGYKQPGTSNTIHL